MEVLEQKVDILAFGVHPDDVELYCAGTILKHIDKGYRVGIVDLTRGELGTRGNGLLRLQEADKSGNILGVDFRYNLNMADGFFSIDEKNIKKISQVLRRHQPKIVFANAMSDRHPDHGRAGQLVKEASYYSGLMKIETGSDPAWRPKAVYHYIQDFNLEPDFLVDVSDYINKKFEAIMAFSSQFYDGEEEDEAIQTPISTKNFQTFLKAKMSVYGRTINASYAEAFTVDRTIGIEDVMSMI